MTQSGPQSSVGFAYCLLTQLISLLPFPYQLEAQCSACPLLGVKRTCPFALHMSANDPKRTCRSRGTCRYLCFGPGLTAFGNAIKVPPASATPWACTGCIRLTLPRGVFHPAA